MYHLVLYSTVQPKDNLEATGLDTIKWWVEMVEVPCVAVGGITLDNIDTVLATNVDFIAILSTLWEGDSMDNASMIKQKISS